MVTSAKLRLFATDGTTDGPKVYLADNSWTEAGINWNNKPVRASTTAAADTAAITAGSWVEYDVSSIVKTDGTYTFDLPPTRRMASSSTLEKTPTPVCGRSSW